ncbi:MAG: competence/damage-inducible protein A [Oscillospiraceae bacterium]|nr:competence/damage-inducible protein A [Oscillospiraceae bacterium]
MIGEILCVGTELLLGDIVNTNAAFLSRQLAQLGIGVYHQTVVGDNPARLKQAVEEALGRSDLVIMTGGLGPTYDDITKEVTAAALGLPLVWNETAYERMQSYFARTGRVLTENNKKQAMAPEGSVVFQNDNGTAPGFAVERDGKTAILLPGPPSEMEPMFLRQVRPFLEGKTGLTFLSRTVHLFGIGESAAESILRDVMEAAQNPTVAPYAKTGEVQIRVTAAAENAEEAQKLLAPTVEKVCAMMDGYVYGVDVDSLQKAAISALKQAGLTAATAESLTGGGVSRRLTEVSGASAVFLGGVCSYTDEVKRRLLGVKEETLKAFGAVSAETALEMARGIRERTGADIGVSTTGVAGPDPSEGKPVGTVFVAVSCGWFEQVLPLQLARGTGNERERVRVLSENHAIHSILQAVWKKEEGEKHAKDI